MADGPQLVFPRPAHRTRKETAFNRQYVEHEEELRRLAALDWAAAKPILDEFAKGSPVSRLWQSRSDTNMRSRGRR